MLKPKREIAILCLSCQTERRGKQKSRIVLDGNQRGSILLFHEPTPSNTGPSYHHVYCRLHQFQLMHHATTHSFSTRFWALLWKQNQWSKGTFTPVCSCYEPLCKSSVCSKGCLAPFLSLPPKYIVNSTTFVFSPDRIDGSKGGACQTPITPLLLLIQGFSVLSSPSAQGNIWTQDLSIFPENKMYYQRIKHQDLLVKLSALPLSLMPYSICEAWSFKRARVLESSPERKLMFISSWIKILLSLPQILCSLSIMSLR